MRTNAAQWVVMSDSSVEAGRFGLMFGRGCEITHIAHSAHTALANEQADLDSDASAFLRTIWTSVLVGYDTRPVMTFSAPESRTLTTHTPAKGKQRNDRFVSSITAQSEDFPGWYNDVVLKAQLADYSPVRGCMVIRPYGYAIWESMRDELDRHIKRTGHENVYFPLFVPRSLLEKEAEHVEGFNPQVAWVTHAGGEELKEWLAIRPTSEAIIAEKVKDWVQSYRDLPLLMNLWNNVVRWELRTRLFLRTTEFLWQEAHTFHATEQEAAEEVATGVEAYRATAEDWLAIPVIRGAKTPNETFPGAIYSHAIEAMMRDGKALQAGTSHMLGQNFSKAAGIEFLDRDNTLKNPYGTSWGFSTRMVGATIMAHGDDAGLVLPPNVAPTQVVIVPIFRSEDDRVAVAGAIESVEKALGDVRTVSGPLRWKTDWREESPGFKYNHWELRGVPFRVEIGPRDVAARQGVLVRRVDRLKEIIALDALAAGLSKRLADYHQMLFLRALDFRAENTHLADGYDEFKAILDKEGGFVMAHWCGAAACEKQINADTGASIRVVPFDARREAGVCMVDGGKSTHRVLFARAY
ncbi:MAG: proline--tRNA ligase [Actinomycetota bacterium]|nr:proline--tRNA ligase [Actinomycetota bacterium]